MNLYCPKWIFDVCVANVASNFIAQDTPIDLSSKSYVRTLNKYYKEIQLIEIKYGAEAIIRFMGEIKNPKYNSFERLRQFLFYTLNYEKKIFIRKRKFKKMFGSAFDGTKKKEYSEDMTLQDFKKFVYSLRSNLVEKAPMSWNINNETEDLEFLGKLLRSKPVDNLLD